MTFEDLILLLKISTINDEIDRKRYDIANIIPVVYSMFGYDQKNAAHQYDLWLHSVNTVLNIPRNLDDDMLYLAALLHDIGKPDCQCRGTKAEDTNMHYYGHPIRSMEIVRDVVIPELDTKGFQIGSEDSKRLLYYIEYHDDHVSLRLKHLRRHLKVVGFEEFQKLMVLQVADAKAHIQIPIVEKRIMICTALAGEAGEELYARILKEEEKEASSGHRSCGRATETRKRKKVKTVNMDKMEKQQREFDLAESIVTVPRVRKIVLKLVDSKELPSDWLVLNDKEVLRVVKPYVYKDCLKENPEEVKEIGNAFGKYCNDITLKAIQVMKSSM